ncbi:GtrA family protein [Nocardia sienata]|uniref:GtrA family protein n=1 Tax=Nocardia sienata TaxID=248552 RepID=UPI0007A3D85F|nr:GtrA family protein [Nocardia sienata]
MTDSAGHPATSRDSPLAEPADPGPLLRLVRRRELAFAVVGAGNTAMGIGLTVGWLWVLGTTVPPSVAVGAAYATGVGIAFALQRNLVFRVRGRVLRDFAAFVAVNSGGLVANAVLLELAVTVLGFPRAPATVGVMGTVAVGSYFGHRSISFRRPVG